MENIDEKIEETKRILEELKKMKKQDEQARGREQDSEKERLDKKQQGTNKRLYSDNINIVESLDFDSTIPEGSNAFPIKIHKEKSFSSLPKPIKLPANIPADVIDILKNKPTHPKFYPSRVILVRKAIRFYSAMCPYPSSDEYICIIEKLGEEFPDLRDPGTKSSDKARVQFGSLLLQLQQGFRNARRDSKPTTRTGNSLKSLNKTPMDLASVRSAALDTIPEVDTLGYNKMVKKMKVELHGPSSANGKARGKVISKLLESTFYQRREWIVNEAFMTIQTIFNEFPALKDPNHIKDECSKVTGMKEIERNVDDNLKLIFSRLLSVVDDSQSEDSENESEDGSDDEGLCDDKIYYALQKVQQILCKKSHIMYESEVGCKLAEVFKQANEPFLVILVSHDKKGKEIRQIFFCCEKDEVCEVHEGIVKAITTLICSYFAFNIVYNKGKNFLKFVQEFLLGLPIEGEKHSPRYCQFSKQIKMI